ncbi:protein-glutamate O-methyltransferase CheR [candidate division WOR-3 bacterium]|nr:protein-glutamate O-methyltransferase CheR [candidate division WOR-3 bacterium]
MKKIEEPDFGIVTDTIKKVMDFEPEHYKLKPLRRRIKARMRRLGIDDYQEYSILLMKDKEEVERLKRVLTINLTRFFRNREVFRVLEKEILPTLTNPSIWSAGCADGAEAYSLSILCHKLNMDCSIIGTDIDSEVIEKAKNGIYKKISLIEIDPEIKKRYFIREGLDYRLINEIRSSVKFENLDLKSIPFKMAFDLTICRNVLIYLNKAFQEQTLLRFYEALKPGGYLILGKIESLAGSAKEVFKPYDIRNRIYAKN